MGNINLRSDFSKFMTISMNPSRHPTPSQPILLNILPHQLSRAFKAFSDIFYGKLRVFQ
jgi:hypothetical protein